MPKYFEDYGSKVFHFIKLKRKLRIIGISKMDYESLEGAVREGERVVVFPYSVFFVFIYMHGISSIYFSKKSVRTLLAQIRYIFLSTFFLIGTIFYLIVSFQSGGLDFFDPSRIDVATIIIFLIIATCVLIPIPSLIKNIRGGIDVTPEVLYYIAKNEGIINEDYSVELKKSGMSVTWGV